jgi:hypothetical protein
MEFIETVAVIAMGIFAFKILDITLGFLWCLLFE